MHCTMGGVTGRQSVAIVSLGCARNDVDSEELAARLEADGFDVVADASAAEAVVVNTCGFVEAAKKDSVDTLLEAAALKEGGRVEAVVAVGCLAERYGRELAAAMPEADAVLGFDDYADIGSRLRAVIAGERLESHTPRDRRTMLPIAPTDRPAHAAPVAHAPPGHAVSGPDLPEGVAPASGPRALRRRLGSGPMAPVKLASGCDRRCSFCAIPRFRGSFVSRPPDEIVSEAGWLAGHGVREVFLVSENSTSYGKDLGDLRLLESLLGRLAMVDEIARIRVSYLQPAEMRPSLVEAIGGTPGVAAYFDLSFQHAAPTVLRRMRRFGDADRFLDLLSKIRAVSPAAGVRSNVIVGFPGETDEDVEILRDFLVEARLDAIGVFGYSDEDGTEAAGLDGHVDAAEIAARLSDVERLAEELTAQRAEDRVGEQVDVLIESVTELGIEGRAAHQGPEVDGSTAIVGTSPTVEVGDLVRARVVASSGVDLVADVLRQ
jgi:ribosomal protein S12 methylthiotransferase